MIRSIIITDPVHQVMSLGTEEKFRALLKDLLDTATFQRLRRISQLGLAQYVFPGATHTRFAHGLGAAYLASRALTHLYERHSRDEIVECRREVIAAALLHDVGHGPFSHSFEQILKGLPALPKAPPMHEEWTLAAIELEESDIHQALVKHGLDIKKVATAFRKDPDAGPLPKYLRQLVSSQLDVDRMDYLVRDSHFAGVALGRVDIYYLIYCLAIVEHDSNALCTLGLEEKGVKAYEGFALARQLMNRTVYYHRAVKVFEFMMEELLRQVVRGASQLSSDSEIWSAVPPYLRCLGGNSPPLATADFVAKHWREYFALAEPDVWHLVGVLAAGNAAKIPPRAKLLAQMLLRREKLAYWQVRPGMAEVLEEKLILDGLQPGEDFSLIDARTTVYKQRKDQVFVILGKDRIAELAASSEIIAMLRDREERATLLLVIEPDKTAAVHKSGSAVQALRDD